MSRQVSGCNTEKKRDIIFPATSATFVSCSWPQNNPSGVCRHLFASGEPHCMVKRAVGHFNGVFPSLLIYIWSYHCLLVPWSKYPTRMCASTTIRQCLQTRMPGDAGKKFAHERTTGSRRLATGKHCRGRWGTRKRQKKCSCDAALTSLFSSLVRFPSKCNKSF